jgi:selenocysteine lyase/cysteine desulfurase
MGAGHRSRIVAADVPGGSAEALHHHLAGLGNRCSYRKGRLRLSVHAYTDKAEIHRAAEACSRCLDAPPAGTPRDAMSPSR